MFYVSRNIRLIVIYLNPSRTGCGLPTKNVVNPACLPAKNVVNPAYLPPKTLSILPAYLQKCCQSCLPTNKKCRQSLPAYLQKCCQSCLPTSKNVGSAACLPPKMSAILPTCLQKCRQACLPASKNVGKPACLPPKMSASLPAYLQGNRAVSLSFPCVSLGRTITYILLPRKKRKLAFSWREEERRNYRQFLTFFEGRQAGLPTFLEVGRQD